MSGRSRRGQPLPRRSLEPAAAEAAPADAPDWLTRPAPSPVPAPEPLRPSRLLAEPDPWPAAAGAPGAALLPGADLALRRGRAVHLLLQRLPGVPEAERHVQAMRLLGRDFPDDPALAESVIEETRAVLADPALADLFGPNSRAEVALAGRVRTAQGDYAVSGRIDRLVRTAAGWQILDYKTGRAPGLAGGDRPCSTSCRWRSTAAS